MKNILTAVSAIATTTTALAFSAGLFAPSAYSAELLIGDEGQVVKIESLEVDGFTYDVDFLLGDLESLYQGTFDFATGLDAYNAAEAVVSALGITFFTAINPTPCDALDAPCPGTVERDDFYIPYLSGGGSVRVVWDSPSKERDSLADVEFRDIDSLCIGLGLCDGVPFAKFTEVRAGGGSSGGSGVQVPEPSLILGFITLGGVLLGSKKQNKG